MLVGRCGSIVKPECFTRKAHLHFGLELIFDESQKDSNNEIWVSCYELVKFLNLNRCETVKVEGTKEWKRVYGIKDPSVPAQPATPSQPTEPPQS